MAYNNSIMDDRHRCHIVKKMPELISLTNYPELMTLCVDRNLLTIEQRHEIEAIDPNQISSDTPDGQLIVRECHERLFLKLFDLGMDSYRGLKQILVHKEWDEAVRILNEPTHEDSHFASCQASPDGNCLQNNNFVLPPPAPITIELKEYTGDTTPLSPFTVIPAKTMGSSPLECYPMRSQHNRGVFLMVNNIVFPREDSYRNGAEHDGHALLHLNKQLGFKVFSYTNLSQPDFTALLHKLVVSQYLRDCECFKMALMSHGDREGSTDYVEFSDGSVMKVEMILEYFTHQRCRALRNKPKIFLFPFCRGRVADIGHYPFIEHDGIAKEVVQGKVRMINEPSTADMIICYAATPGYRTHRDPDTGSWYIQLYCETMAKHAHNTDFEDILKIVSKEVSAKRTKQNYLQMGSYVNCGFNKKLFYNPGLWEVDDNTYATLGNLQI